jgi:hypothetical protein
MSVTLTKKQRDDVYSYVKTKTFIPSDFDTDEKLKLFIYDYINMWLKGTYKTFHRYEQEKSQIHDRNVDLFIECLVQFKRDCENWLKKDKSNTYHHGLLRKLIMWKVKGKRVKDKDVWYNESILNRDDLWWDKIDNTYLIEDKSSLTPEILFDYKDIIKTELNHTSQHYIKRKPTSNFVVTLVGDVNPNLYFDSLNSVERFFGLKQSGARRYTKSYNRKRSFNNSRIILKIEKLKR